MLFSFVPLFFYGFFGQLSVTVLFANESGQHCPSAARSTPYPLLYHPYPGTASINLIVISRAAILFCAAIVCTIVWPAGNGRLKG